MLESIQYARLHIIEAWDYAETDIMNCGTSLLTFGCSLSQSAILFLSMLNQKTLKTDHIGFLCTATV